jgi:N-methylhydantoinase B
MDAIELEIFGCLFSSIAEEMGVTLQRTGFSPNIKERRDYSCAIFDASAQMIAQAAHIPVHLGAMPLSTKAAIDAIQMQPGDAVILNDPFQGGTHLPDITIVTPVFLPKETTPRFYLANRAHHADVGGITPGSMPLSRSIDEEGVLISPQLLLRRGERVEGFFQFFLPQVRTPSEREGDLSAQLAANHVGERRLREAAEKYGAEKLSEAAEALCAYAEKMTRAAIQEIPAGEYSFTDILDDDGLSTKQIAIEAVLRVPGDGSLEIDFSKSSPQVEGCVNAVYAITLSACHYVFRALVDFDIPANSGVTRAIRVIAPSGSILDAKPPAAVAGGNVETSQRIVDVLLGALAKALPEKIPAASAGTMNNLTFGGVLPNHKHFAYYETIAGGAGAGPSWAGASAVQTHMTNTLNTPIEALEHTYPIQIERYRIAAGSGGRGQHNGGDGVERAFRFLVPATVTLLSERRENAPWGLSGGESGAKGENLLQREGEQQTLPGKASFEAKAGDLLVIKTPGGGGWGRHTRKE